jgi:thiosulfate/3-mercaptopyruvate sulfurtransferase
MRYQTIVSAETLLNHLPDPGWVIVDCRFSLAEPDTGRQAWLASHISGAHYAHLDNDLAGPVTPQTGRHPLPDPDALRHVVGGWGVTPRSQVVAYDDAGGAMAARLWWLLRWLGHHDVAVLDGGWQAWQAAGYPVSPLQPVELPSCYPNHDMPRTWLGSDEVQDALEENEILLVDARAAERFSGRVEPIDPVAGHVPCALNRPCQANLDASGRFKSAEQLRDEFEQLLAGRAADEVVHMCGSGVTACHNLLAMEHAGLSGSRLYPGSWSEWIRSARRPVEPQR